MNKFLEKTLKSDTVYEGTFLTVLRDEVQQQDGQIFYREYLKHPGAALIIPQLPDGKLLFIQQFRHALQDVFIEFPAGKRDHGEDYETTARRELLEETGYEAKSLEFMFSTHPVIGYSDERIDCFYAKDLIYKHAPTPDPGEILEPLILTLDEALDALKKGKITDSKTSVALLWFAQWTIKKNDIKSV